MSLIRYQVDLVGLAGGPGLSTYHFDGTIGPSSNTDISDAVRAMWVGIATIMSSTVVAEGRAFVEELDPATGEITLVEPAPAWSEAGDLTTEKLPNATQGLIKWDTGVYVAGRRLQGKTFVPGPTEGHNTTLGRPHVDYYGTLQNIGDTLLSGITGPVVYSKTHGVYHPITSAIGWSEWAVLRGRRS